MTPAFDCEPVLEALSREIGQFETRVAILEEKCRQIRSCIGLLGAEFREKRGSAELSKAMAHSLERLSVERAVALCRMQEHVELDEATTTVVVHEPDGGRTIVDESLATCALDNGELAKELRSRIARLCNDGVSSMRLLCVPTELDLKACFAGHEQLLQSAAARHVVVAPPLVLLSVLKSIAVRWLSSACGQSARSIVDKGQDLVDELSAFISDFTESERQLCSLVDDCAQVARRREPTLASHGG